MYPSNSKCNAKRCNCCKYLWSNSTVTSFVNSRKFSAINDSKLDENRWPWYMFYLEILNIVICSVLEKLVELLENGLVNIIAEFKSLKRLLLFFINIFNVQVILLLILWWKKNVKKIEKSSSRFKNIRRHQTELEWIILWQTPFPLGFNNNIY